MNSEIIINNVDITNIYNVFKVFYTKNDGHGLEHINDVIKRCSELDKSIDNKLQPNTKLYVLAALTHDMFQELDRENHHHLSYMFIKTLSNFVNKQKTYLTDEDKLKELRQDFKETSLNDLLEFLNINSDNFHKDLYDLIHKENILFTPKHLDIVANMCLNHRSSIQHSVYKDKENTIFIDVFRVADKEPPILSKVIERCVKATMFNHDQKPLNNVDPEIYKIFKGNGILTIDQLVKIRTHLIDKFTRSGYMFTNIEPMYLEYHKDEIEDFHNELDLLLVNGLENYCNSLIKSFTITFSNVKSFNTEYNKVNDFIAEYKPYKVSSRIRSNLFTFNLTMVDVDYMEYFKIIMGTFNVLIQCDKDNIKVDFS